MDLRRNSDHTDYCLHLPGIYSFRQGFVAAETQTVQRGEERVERLPTRRVRVRLEHSD